MDIGHRGRLDSWTTQFRHTNEISTSNGSVLQLPAGARPLDESESASVADGESSAAVSEPGDDEEGLVMQATEWSQVVAARGIRGVRVSVGVCFDFYRCFSDSSCACERLNDAGPFVLLGRTDLGKYPPSYTSIRISDLRDASSLLILKE